jgi:hypothetical protein
MSTDAARRQALYKHRRAAGEVTLRLVVDDYALIEALLDSNRVSEADALDRRKVEEAVALVVSDWIQRWRDDASPDRPADR